MQDLSVGLLKPGIEHRPKRWRWIPRHGLGASRGLQGGGEAYKERRLFAAIVSCFQSSGYPIKLVHIASGSM